MTIRTAACRCGRLTAACNGDPIRVSVCHCLDCQRRSGSAFAAQARWSDDHVTIAGGYAECTHEGGEGRRATFRFCPNCGGTIAFTNESLPGTIAVPIGAFADPHFPPPAFSVFESRKHGWVTIDITRHFD